ncbi:ecotin family protein [Thiofilum flexile]|uniref:ecotin family protein n=1 Tax=Thiofilum flexile TaxID=125627 RepID=UPI000363C268|nr:ecotin family protein [Thiofilum flexile]
MMLKNVSIIALATMVWMTSGLVQATGSARGNPESYQYGMKLYPAAPAGYTRMSIRLPKLAGEEELLLVFRAGKQMMTDCNYKSIPHGSWREQTVQGWGLDYYTLNTNGEVETTVMECVDKKEEKQIFVRAGDVQYVRYNSRMPIVVYVPKGYEVRYNVMVSKSEGVGSPE